MPQFVYDEVEVSRSNAGMRIFYSEKNSSRGIKSRIIIIHAAHLDHLHKYPVLTR